MSDGRFLTTDRYSQDYNQATTRQKGTGVGHPSLSARSISAYRSLSSDAVPGAVLPGRGVEDDRASAMSSTTAPTPQTAVSPANQRPVCSRIDCTAPAVVIVQHPDHGRRAVCTQHGTAFEVVAHV